MKSNREDTKRRWSSIIEILSLISIYLWIARKWSSPLYEQRSIYSYSLFIDLIHSSIQDDYSSIISASSRGINLLPRKQTNFLFVTLGLYEICDYNIDYLS